MDKSELAGEALSDNTRRCYSAAIDRFKSWLGDRKTEDATVSEYLLHLYQLGFAPASGNMIAAALRWEYRSRRKPPPVGDLAAETLKNFRKAAAGRGYPARLGIQWPESEHMATLAERGGDLHGLRDAAMISTMSDALLRISELVALDLTDIESEATNTILIRRSKTDQQASGSVLFLGAVTISRIRAWTTLAGLEAGGPLFRPVLSDQPAPTRISTKTAQLRIKLWARKAGITGRISGHSFRIGSAQSLATAGAGLVDLQTAGRWKSPTMPGHYARNQLVTDGPIARYKYGIRRRRIR